MLTSPPGKPSTASILRCLSLTKTTTYSHTFSTLPHGWMDGWSRKHGKFWEIRSNSRAKDGKYITHPHFHEGTEKTEQFSKIVWKLENVFIRILTQKLLCKMRGTGHGSIFYEPGTQKAEAPAALPEDLASVPSTHRAVHNHFNSSSRGPHTAFDPSGTRQESGI